VVPPIQSWKEETMSMQVLFGDCCADPKGMRAWDEDMRTARMEWEALKKARAEMDGDRAGKNAAGSSQKAEETESDEEEDEFETAQGTQKNSVGGELERATVAAHDGHGRHLNRPEKQVHPPAIAGLAMGRINNAAGTTAKEKAGRPVVVQPEQRVPISTPPQLTTATTTPLRRSSTQRKVQDTRKRALDGMSHLSPAYRLKVRDAAYAAALEGTWAQSRPRLSTTQAYDSDEEL